ncbi:MAG: hypothetical protein JKY19_06250 [Alcanivoracaceae bacterium]|nr:hypothetical protein [Alcanivoracaceae bacterium]
MQALDKLPNTRIRSLVQDKQGYLWFATDNNLWRFDGYKLKSYTDILSMQGQIVLKEISKLYVSENNSLWIASKLNGLFKISSNSITSFQHNASDNKSISSNTVSAILEENDNSLWIGTNNGLNHLLKNNEFKYYPFSKALNKTDDVYITSIISLSENKLLVGTMTGLFSFNTDTHEYIKIKIGRDIDKILIYTILKDKDQKIWLGTSLGLFLKEPKSQHFFEYKPKLIHFPVLTIFSSDKNIWVGSILEGLIKISKKDGNTTIFKHQPEVKDSISDNSITSLMLDRAGVLWVNSFNGGVNFIDTKALNFNLETSSDSSLFCSESSIIYGIDQEGDNTWLASEKGVTKFNEEKKQCVLYNKGVEGDVVFGQKIPLSTNLDNKSQRWVATSMGLSKINENSMLVDVSNQFYNYKNTYFSSKYDSDKILLGTDNGLFTYDTINAILNPVAVANISLNGAKFYNYYKDANNKFYFATNLGIAYFNDNKKLILSTKIQSYLPTTEITSIYTVNNEIWVGTYLHGLFHFNQQHELIKRYDESNGIPTGLSIQGILSDAFNNLWLSTDDGLIKLNIKTGLSHTFHLSDGLQNNYFIRASSHKTSDGKLYFGGRNGFNAFYPEDITINEIPPNIVLTDFSRFGKPQGAGIKKDGFLLNKPINELAELTLSHKDYVVGFEFAALGFADPSRNKYAYMMEGQDPGWTYVDADNRRISYSNLKAGKYTFRVKGSNKDGVWNEVGKSLNIVVKPASWFSWWA